MKIIIFLTRREYTTYVCIYSVAPMGTPLRTRTQYSTCVRRRRFVSRNAIRRIEEEFDLTHRRETRRGNVGKSFVTVTDRRRRGSFSHFFRGRSIRTFRNNRYIITAQIPPTHTFIATDDGRRQSNGTRAVDVRAYLFGRAK